MNLRFVRGGIGNVESFREACYGYDIRTEIVGSKRTVQVGYLRQTAQVVLNLFQSLPDACFQAGQKGGAERGGFGLAWADNRQAQSEVRFAHGEELVGGNVPQYGHGSAGPADFDLVHLGGVAQAEMEARVRV